MILGDSGYSTADWADFEVELEAWVTGGGGLIVTGYGARATICSLAPLIAAMLPVACDESVGNGESLTVVEAAHPIADQVGDFVLDPQIYMDTSATLAIDGLGLLTSVDGDWAVAVRDHGAGRVTYLAPVYMGATSSYSHLLRDAEADLLLEEAAAWTAGCVDGDGDGDDDVFCGGGDCDDDDPDRYAGAPELCNAVDDDCDGVVPGDELDDDHDSFSECEGDCDDADPSLNLADADDDGYSTCDGDCDDDDPAQNLDDLDGDGYSVCDADCNDEDPALTPLDGDADGYSTCSGDCDDGSPDAYPGATELCDAQDNDCDGWTPIDELDGDGDGSSPCMGDCDDTDPALNGLDGDGDGFSTCELDCDDTEAALYPADNDGDGQSPCDGDCDDFDATRFDGAEEICNGIDDDCDGVLDDDEVDGDGDGSAVCEGDCNDGDAAMNPADMDGDGYDTCGSTTGVPDCDDTDDGVHPGATEICGNGLDDDCSGAIDDLPACDEEPAGDDDDEFQLQRPNACGCRQEDSARVPGPELAVLAVALLAIRRRHRR